MTAMSPDPLWFAALPDPGGALPLDDWNPPFCGDSRMRIARDGTWFHDGQVITRPGLVRLFAGLLRREGDGFVLVTPAEKLSIAVEDVPFLAVTLNEGVLLALVTRTGDRVVLDDQAGWTLKDGIPHVTVRPGLQARIARPLYYQLVQRAEERDGMLGVVSGPHFLALGPAA
jgi:hypothetical protein